MYLEHFKLSTPPFQFTTSPSNLFMSDTHREGLAALEWGLLYEPGGLTLLAGETGLGKTTLVCSLLARRYQQVHAAYLSNPKLSYEELLASVLNQLRINGGRSSKAAMLNALVHFANSLTPDQRIAIIVDEAQVLSDDTLEEFRLLSNLERQGRKASQIILVGQFELLQRLANSEMRHLNDRISARAILSPLSRKESREYVEHRLRTGKGTARQVFKPRALDYLVDHADGIPRRINALCHNAMLLAYSAGAKQVALPMAKTAVAEYNGLHAAAAQRPRRHLRWFSKRRDRSILRPILALGLLGGMGFGAAYLALDRHVVCHLRSLGSAIVDRQSDQATPAASSPDRSGALAPRPQFQPSTDAKVIADIPSDAHLALSKMAPAAPSLDQPLGVEPNKPAVVQHVTPARSEDGRYVVVGRGDTLEGIAQRYLGSDDELQRLLRANPQITDIQRIYSGERINLPGLKRPVSATEELVRGEETR